MSAFDNPNTPMEEGSLSHQNGGVQMGPQGVSTPNNKQGDETAAAAAAKAQYSIPGILHFIQHEWARFELERSQWEVDRAELQVLSLVHHSLTVRSEDSFVGNS